MATTPDMRSDSPAGEESVLAAADALDALMQDALERLVDPEFAESLSEQLRVLHARFRTHTAADIRARDEGLEIAPHLVDDFKRLREEHVSVLGSLDRLIRSTESIGDASLEDKEVFVLRVIELIATLRRHMAEDDRIFYFSMWQDIGGES